MIETIAFITFAVSLITMFIAIIILSKIKPQKNDFNGGALYNSLKEIIALTASALSDSGDRNSQLQRERIKSLEDIVYHQSKLTEQRLIDLTSALDGNLKHLNQSNLEQLELMRLTVDEKLEKTLHSRLDKSFQLVSERLEAVYKGIGEMRDIAGNVTDLKKVFSNIKLRGTWGELQLDSMLSQMLAPNQYIKNCKINKKDNDNIVDFAITLPGKDSQILLPIDSKFPMEEFTRYLSALDTCDKDIISKAEKSLERTVKLQADSIAKKYISPPLTTDFAIMYFPVESLYAECLKIDGLVESLQKSRIMMCGPANIAALLTTLQSGFKTIIIEKRSAELWSLLSAFKHEFSKFTELLLRTQKKLQEAQNSIDDAAKKTRRIERQLKDVSEITSEESDKLLLSDE